MTINVVLGLITGVVFTSVGIGGFLFSSEKKLHFTVPFLLGSWMLYLHLFGALSVSSDKLNEIVNINSNEVQVIIINPTKKVVEDKSLVQNPFLVKDKVSIDKICKVLNKAEKIHDAYIQHEDWLAEVIINNIKFGVTKYKNRTEISVHSDGEYGWNYGSLKCDELGKILENEIIK